MIPLISPYPMPGAEELPANVAGWQPDPARAVLLIHDMQQYFVDFFTPGTPPVSELVANIVRLRQAAAGLRLPVIYTAQPGGMTREQRGLLQDFWGPGMDQQEQHRGIIAELAPAPEDVILTKWRYSAFYRSALAELLAKQHRDQLLICGIFAHVGCLMTACDAFTRDIQPFLVADAVADFDRESHDMTLGYAAQRCAVTIGSDELLTILDRRAAGVHHV
jgi:isochorismate hydrolase